MASPLVKVNLRTDAEPKRLLLELLLSPLIYLRLAAVLFSIIVFGCVSDQVYRVLLTNNNVVVCDFNESNACSFAVAIGVIAFLICMVFLVKDVFFVLIDFSEAMQIKKVILLADAGVSGFWAFMWFVCFCFTTDQRHSPPITGIRSTAETNCANAAIAFSFFSIIIWVAMVGFNVFLLLRIFQGRDRDDTGAPSAGGNGGGGYASFPSDNPDGDETPYTPPEY